MFYGIIKNIASDRGFGFIGQEGGPDVFFHATVIGQELFAQLRPDQPVKFELVKLTEEERERRRALKEKKGPQAAKIEPIERMPGGILERPPQELAPRHHPRARQRKATWKRRIDLGGAGRTE